MRTTFEFLMSLLQENGYIVLRFLAKDLAEDLDGVLDAILRSLRRQHGSFREHTVNPLRLDLTRP